MTTERFLALLAAYGAEPRRWPEAERAAALAFLASAPAEVRATHAEASALDAALGDERDAPVPELLARRILRGAPRDLPRLMRPAVAMAACALIGVVLGFGGARLATPTEEGAEAALSVLVDDFYGDDAG
jgi:hypothetical protein